MGCSSSPDNIENKNEHNQITNNQINKANNTNHLQASKSTNDFNSSFNIYNKSKTYLNNKDQKIPPIIISTIGSPNIKEIYLIKVNACSFLKEEMVPIWFEKETYVKFMTKARWRIDKQYNYTDSNGMPSTQKFNYGAAIARIGSGPKFLLAPNEFTYYNKYEGPLYLRMNLPKNMDICPEGTMEVKVFDGKLLSIEEINSKIGWKEKNMNYSSKNSSDLENKLTTDINNLRMNPILFYETFLKKDSNTIWTEDFLINAKYNNDNNQISAFSTNDDLYNSLKKYIKINFKSMKTNLNKRGIDKYTEKLKKQINIYIKNNFGCDNVVDCRKTKKNKSEEICMLYVLDTNFRENIFSNEYYSIAVNILDNVIPDEIFIILVFMKD